MRPVNEARLARIKKISGILRGICKAFLVYCVLGFLVMVRFLVGSRQMPISFPGGGRAVYWQSYNGVAIIVSALTDRERVVLAVILALSWAVMFNCGYQLHRLMGSYSRGEVFTTKSAGQIRKWGIACVLWGVVNFGWMLAPHVIANASKKQPGEGLSLVVNGLVVVAISWFMEMASEMREEQDLII